MYEYLCKEIPGFDKKATNFFDAYASLKDFVNRMDSEVISGIYCIYHKDIFEAVYSTNLLMRKVELLITKPSELAYYPVVKVMMRHIGGHEVYGAIHAQEYGDSTFECPDKKSMNEMLDRLLTDDDLLIHLNKQMIKLKAQGLYNGGYEVVKLAVNGRRSSIFFLMLKRRKQVSSLTLVIIRICMNIFVKRFQVLIKKPPTSLMLMLV